MIKIKSGLRLIAILFFVTSILGVTACHYQQEKKLTAATQTYIYGLPLVLMHITEQVMTNVASPKPNGRAPINQFGHARELPNPKSEDIVRPNLDTLYSMAWLDLSSEPIILSVPDTHGRYYLMQMLDAWTNVFASVGKRTTGTKVNNFIITGPHWQGQTPSDLQPIIAPTNLVWIIGRTQVNGVTDLKNVHLIQDGYKLTPLSKWHKSYSAPRAIVNPNINTETAPAKQLEELDAVNFFTSLAHLLKSNPPSKADSTILKEAKIIGIVPGEEFDASKLTKEQIYNLESGMKNAEAELIAYTKHVGANCNGWHLITKNIGSYGTHYVLRALIAIGGIGANLPQDAVYPTTFVDTNNKILNGSNNYILHFNKSELPPVNAFWSVTLYNGESYLAPNAIHRYALGDRDKLQFNRDGSLDIYLQHDSPGANKESNWLPAPKNDFNLTLRLYWPKAQVLAGKWCPPGVVKLNR